MSGQRYQHQFTGRSFGITAVRGIRGFRADRRGRLFGATGYTWFPGEQLAFCTVAQVDAEAIASGVHDMTTCTCGFYAFADGVSDYWLGISARTPIVHGVIEGYGKVTLGTRGFRASKARLLAIALPEANCAPWEDPTRRAVGSPRVRIQSWKIDLRAFIPLTTVLGVVVGLMAWGLAALGLALLGMPLSPAKWVPVLFLIVGAAFPLVPWRPYLDRRCADRRRFGIGHARTFSRGGCQCSQIGRISEANGASQEMVAQIRRNYPNVAVYPTLAALTAAYPPDAPETKTTTEADDVNTAHDLPSNDPNLWSRPIEEN